jgi:hypothetical protein
MKFLPLALALCLALPLLAQAQTRRVQVYRCGPDGRDLRDSPCPNGSAEASAEQPGAADDKASRARHLAEVRQAAAQAQARRASEADARHQRAQATGLQDQPASAPQPAKPGKPVANAAR